MNKFIKWGIVFPILMTISGGIVFAILYAIGILDWIHIIPIAAVLGFIDALLYLTISEEESP